MTLREGQTKRNGVRNEEQKYSQQRLNSTTMKVDRLAYTFFRPRNVSSFVSAVAAHCTKCPQPQLLVPALISLAAWAERVGVDVLAHVVDRAQRACSRERV